MFAIQNAEAAYWFSSWIRWEFSGINATGGSQPTHAFGYVLATPSSEPPPDAIGNNWIGGSFALYNKSVERRAGNYRLLWSLTMTHCRETGPRTTTSTQPSWPAAPSASPWWTTGAARTSNSRRSAPNTRTPSVSRARRSTTRGTYPFMSKYDGEKPDFCKLRPD